MRHVLFMLSLIPSLISSQTFSRDLLASGGGTETNASVEWSFSIGEPVIQVREGGNPTLYWLQGFQQPSDGFSILPVEWLDFTATKIDPSQNELSWTVQQLGGESHYVVERSIDGSSFIELARVDDYGQALEINTYTWIDTDFPETLLYYRVRQMDQDGRFSYSSVRIIDQRTTTTAILFYPNPTPDRILWTSTSGNADKLEWRLYDALGQLLIEHDLLQMSTNSISLLALPQGTYFYTLDTGKATQKGRIVKAE
ncbi:MAG: T9SS type A sorting domain-containing protein [Bacteroidota bacterium]